VLLPSSDVTCDAFLTRSRIGSKTTPGRRQVASILCLRDPETERPFRLPLGVTIPAIAAVLCVLLFTQQPAINLLAALGALVVGLVLYAVGRFGLSSTRSGN